MIKYSGDRLTFRPDIDGLRAIAVVLVVASHCSIPGFSGGFVGVDVFFVLSGYLITSILVNEARTSGRINLVGFYARRIRRLLPASAFMVLTTLVMGMLVMAPNELEFTGRAARATALYLSNVFFALNGGDYFGQAVQGNPLLHTWSLAVEEQFYLFWPLAILLGFWLGGFRNAKALPWILATILIASLIASVALSTSSPVHSYYGLHTRAWEFAVGGLAGILPAGALRIRPFSARILSWIGFAGILAGAVVINSEVGYPGYHALLPVLSTTLVLVCAKEFPDAGAVPLLSTSPLQVIGTVSYSWYLWHWPILVVAAAVAVDITLAGKLMAALLSLAVAIVSYRFIENPIRHAPRLAENRVASLMLGATLTASCAAISIAIISQAKYFAKSDSISTFVHAAEDVASMQREACVNLRGNDEPLQCSFGHSTSNTTVVLFGDSHAIQWFDGFLKAAENREWHLVTFLKSGCPAADISPVNLWASDEKECARWRRKVLNNIERMKPTTVALASYSGAVERGANRSRISAIDWEAATRRTLQALQPNVKRSILILDTPTPGFDVPSCLARNALHPLLVRHDCSFSQEGSVNWAARGAEQSAAAAATAATFDPLDLLCKSGYCPAFDGGIVIYRDDNHMSARYASELTPAIEAAVERALIDVKQKGSS